MAVGTELTTHQSRLRDSIANVTDARLRIYYTLLALVLLMLREILEVLLLNFIQKKETGI
jgi:hypothetical protein